MTDEQQRYVPAAGRAAFTRLYDPVVAMTMRERRFRGALLDQVRRDRPERVVDVGCGTGTFAIALAHSAPDVIAVDGDDDVLALAQTKDGAEHVTWVPGLAGELPLDDASADVVTMSLLLHHLAPDAKSQALRDVRRVLRPGGALHIADWGRPQDPLMRATFFGLQLLDGFSTTRDHAAGRLPEIVAAAGFMRPERTLRLRTLWGTLELLRAGVAPSASA